MTILIAGMVRALQPEFVLETGACLGNTAEAIGKALLKNGHGALVTLESEPSLAAAAHRRCRRLPVSVVRASSLDYVPHRPIDFAFFDSLVKLRVAEFERFRPWMHPQTVVAFHDTGPQHDLRRRLRDLEKQGLLVAPLYLPTPRGVMFASPSFD